MLSKTPFRIAGAAMLGTVVFLGTNAANAEIDRLDDRTTAVTYAKETLTSTVDEEDNRSYYVVVAESDDDGRDTDALNLAAEQGCWRQENGNKMVVTDRSGRVEVLSDWEWTHVVWRSGLSVVPQSQ